MNKDVEKISRTAIVINGNGTFIGGITTDSIIKIDVLLYILCIFYSHLFNNRFIRIDAESV